jgi:hypothetical protein
VASRKEGKNDSVFSELMNFENWYSEMLAKNQLDKLF